MSIEASRINRRIGKIKEVLPILESWLADILREGLARVLSRPYSFWDNMSKNLTDYQAKGLATMITDFNLAGKDKADFEQLYEQLSMLYLLVQALKKIETFDEDFQADLLTLAGVSSRKEDILLHGKSIKDHWQVLGIHEYEEQRKLKVRKVWFYGKLSGKYALLLDFVYGEGASFVDDFSLSLCLEAELCFYPSAYPLRALLKKQESIYFSTETSHFQSSFETFLTTYSDALAANPWLTKFPCRIAHVEFLKDADVFQLVDKEGFVIPISSKFDKQWQLYLFSEGKEFAIFGEWNAKNLVPLAVYKADAYQSLV